MITGGTKRKSMKKLPELSSGWEYAYKQKKGSFIELEKGMIVEVRCQDALYTVVQEDNGTFHDLPCFQVVKPINNNKQEGNPHESVPKLQRNSKLYRGKKKV